MVPLATLSLSLLIDERPSTNVRAYTKAGLPKSGVRLRRARLAAAAEDAEKADDAGNGGGEIDSVGEMLRPEAFGISTIL